MLGSLNKPLPKSLVISAGEPCGRLKSRFAQMGAKTRSCLLYVSIDISTLACRLIKIELAIENIDLVEHTNTSFVVRAIELKNRAHLVPQIV